MAGNREYKSDAFEYPVERPELELICKVYNINKGSWSFPLSRP